MKDYKPNDALVVKALSLLLIAAMMGACTAGWPLATEGQRGELPPQAGIGRCVGLSGGGIRSGAVSLGVLQGLHQEQELSSIDSIAAVSGGGYPLYGVMTQMIENHRTLDDLLRPNSEYVAHVESRAAFLERSDIYSIAVGALVTSPFPAKLEGSGYAGYVKSIHDTFSGGAFFSRRNPYVVNSKITQATALGERGLPTPIFVASANRGLYPPPSRHVYTLQDVFEVTPTRIGNPALGYFDASSRFGKWISTADAVAMSAAAIDTPQGDFQLPAIAKAVDFGLSRHFYAPAGRGRIHFTLADGGFVDNLGVVPLLRRGCSEIIVFDNSDDSDVFDAWLNLRRRIGKNEEPGWIVSRELESATLHLSLQAFESNRKVEDEERDRWKWQLREHVWRGELANDNRSVSLTIVKLGIDRARLERYPEEVRQFALQNWKETDGPTCSGKGLHRSCSFPLEATARQSFSPQEFSAYRELGIWLARIAVGKVSEF